MEKRAKDGTTKSSLKKRHLGMAGLITVLMQYGVGVKDERATSRAFQEALKAQMNQARAEMRVERERDFVRKSDLAPILSKLDSTLTTLAAGQNAMNVKVGKIETYLQIKRGRGPDFGMADPEAESAEVSQR